MKQELSFQVLCYQVGLQSLQVATHQLRFHFPSSPKLLEAENVCHKLLDAQHISTKVIACKCLARTKEFGKNLEVCDPTQT